MDDTDRALVRTLREDGRASYAELGRRVGLSGASVQERVRRLEERGVITGYRAVVPPAVLDLGVTALVGILLADDASHEEVGRRLAEVEQIEDCWLPAGEEAYLVKVRARDVEDLGRFVVRMLAVTGVARTRTTVVLQTRWEGRLPVGAPPGEADVAEGAQADSPPEPGP